MEYEIAMVWTVIKRFLAGWAAAAVFLVVASCVKYREFIGAAFAENTWALINAFMPVVIMFMALGYMLRSVFR